MMKTIEASSHSVTSESSSLRRMKRAIACLRAVPSNGWVDEGGGRSRRPQALRCQATWEVVAKDIWPRALENTPVNLLELPAR